MRLQISDGPDLSLLMDILRRVRTWWNPISRGECHRCGGGQVPLSEAMRGSLQGMAGLWRVRRLPLTRRGFDAFPSEEPSIDRPQTGAQHRQRSSNRDQKEAGQLVGRQSDEPADFNNSHQSSCGGRTQTEDEENCGASQQNGANSHGRGRAGEQSRTCIRQQSETHYRPHQEEPGSRPAARESRVQASHRRTFPSSPYSCF